ncbi:MULTISPECIES: serine/threonine protein kinase [Protofrankia]|uniref:Serine/threonine protein kinase n=1 Tax=Candidatus Protofrankia datiscae TaxID=2716812 RepID=F8B220_9ACTN|nr:MULTISPECIES: serine/threonine protein kinase [Protofrankia]AEH08889.1 serine/threonine protein kinase [Candidatus Protofrankia datiscae]
MKWQSVAVERQWLGRVDLLSRGGQAVVYRLPEFGLPEVGVPLVYKEYRSIVGRVPAQGLANIIALQLALPADQRLWFDTHLAWPLRIVVDSDADSARAKVLGVVMRLIPDAFFQVSPTATGRSERRPSEARSLFAGPEQMRALGLPFPDRAQRWWLCLRLAYLVAFLHNQGIVFGDISARNVLYRLRPTPDVLLVDCDAVRKVGNAAVVDQGHTPDFFPPVIHEPQSISSDLFKLGLFIVRILAPGRTVTPESATRAVEDALDRTGMDLVRASLSADPSARPAALAWYRYLRSGAGSHPRTLPLGE